MKNIVNSVENQSSVYFFDRYLVSFRIFFLYRERIILNSNYILSQANFLETLLFRVQNYYY